MATSRLCSIPGCDKAHAGKGYCQAHFKRWRRYGDPLILRRPKPNRNPPATCSIEGCQKLHHSFGLCLAHYTRQRRHGNPTGGGTPIGAPLNWLRQHVNHQADDCLQWPFARIKQGGVVQFEGTQTTAAAVMCLLAHGPKPTPSHEAAHNCGKARDACVNPRHLRWATRSDNHLDKYAHGTMPIGEKSPRHILTEEQVRAIRRREEPVKAMADRYGVTAAAIYAVLSNRNWRSLV